MTLTVDDRELIERLRDGDDLHSRIEAADRLQSLLSDRDKLEDVTPAMLLAGREQAVLQCVRIEDFQMKRIYVAMLNAAALTQTEVPLKGQYPALFDLTGNVTLYDQLKQHGINPATVPPLQAFLTALLELQQKVNNPSDKL